ncbi:MAG: hypothetical protein ACI8QY_000252 [bacterium]|jgi:hypothetical protein
MKFDNVLWLMAILCFVAIYLQFGIASSAPIGLSLAVQSLLLRKMDCEHEKMIGNRIFVATPIIAFVLLIVIY